MKSQLFITTCNDDFFIRFEETKRERKQIRNEATDVNPYDLLINSSSITETMLALEGLNADFFEFSYANVPCNPFNGESSKTLARLFAETPTRTDIKKTKEAIEVWGTEERVPKGEIKPYIRVSDAIRLAKDLKACCIMLAYSTGKCEERFVREFFTHPPFFEEQGENDALGEYYQSLLHAHHTQFIECNFMNHGVNCYTDDVKKVICGNHARAAFNMMFSSITLSFPYIHAPTENAEYQQVIPDCLSELWRYYAEKISQNKIGVCSYCGKVFTRQRTTKNYCSHSCSQSRYERGANEEQPVSLEELKRLDKEFKDTQREKRLAKKPLEEEPGVSVKTIPFV